MDNCFNFYLDYLLECIADPDFPKIIRGDPRARKHYDYAIHKIEIDELARWRYICQVAARYDHSTNSHCMADSCYLSAVATCVACMQKPAR